MHRRAQAVIIGNALLIGAAAVAVAIIIGKGLIDPEGSFLGPSAIRLPLLLLGAILLDLLPRTLWFSKLKPAAMPDIVRERLRTHWTGQRMALVALGVMGFYVIYVSYRNLKSFLPFVVPDQDGDGPHIYDRDLHLIDRALFFGHEPATVMHDLFGSGVSAYFLSYVYLWFLPLVPLAVTAWVVWSRNLSYGYWFVTSQGIAWTLGTISYYALPTLGPGIKYPYLYSNLPDTPTNSLMEALVNGRQGVVYGGVEGAVQSVAGFASLHCAITLLMALMVTYTLRSKPLKIFFWINFGFTFVATIYFGWHYVSDDIAGIMIALTSFYLGGLASGQRFHRRGIPHEATVPATSTAVPANVD